MDIIQAAPRNAQYVVLTANGVLTDERALTGTANQVVITDNGAGSSVVLSLPQSIHTGASPTFAGLTLSAPAAASTAEELVRFTISDDLGSYFAVNNATDQDALFAPQLKGYYAGASQAGLTMCADALSDTGAVALMQFKSTVAGGAVGTRPLFQWLENTTPVMTIDSAGTVVIPAGLTLSGLTAGRVPIVSTAGLLADNAALTWDNTNLRLALIGTDAALKIGNVDVGAPVGALQFSIEGSPTISQPTFERLADVAGALTAIFRKGRGTFAAPRRTQSGDVLGGFVGQGAMAADDVSDASWTATNSGALRFYAAEAFTTTGRGGYVRFDTVAVGTTGLTERLRLTAQGNTVIGGGALDPSTGTSVLVFADGTAPSGMASNSAGLYGNDDGGTVKVYAIDEAGSAALLNYRNIALGGGAAPTLGTIGGSGPATAGQNSWLEFNIGGTAYWVPAWV